MHWTRRASTITRGFVKKAQFALDYDDLFRGARARALYGDSGYYNVGYWKEGISSLPQACDAMVDELASCLPADARRILDVGCGLGTGTRRLAQIFPHARIIAGNISHWQLLQAQGRGVRAAAVLDAARLPFADASLDAVVAVESPQHFDTRAAFLAEALRVLRPGGVLSVADMLFRDRAAIGDWMLPPANDLADPAAYAEALAGCGYGGIRVRDVTSITWAPFCEQMRPLFSGSEARWEAILDCVSHYVLACARNP